MYRHISIHRNLRRSDKYYIGFGHRSMRHGRTVHVLFLGPICVVFCLARR